MEPAPAVSLEEDGQRFEPPIPLLTVGGEATGQIEFISECLPGDRMGRRGSNNPPNLEPVMNFPSLRFPANRIATGGDKRAFA